MSDHSEPAEPGPKQASRSKCQLTGSQRQTEEHIAHELAQDKIQTVGDSAFFNKKNRKGKKWTTQDF